jgi:hypothetical protein
VRAANLAVRFLLEITSIVMLAALAFSGGTPIAMRVAGLVGALAFVALWARYVAPKSSRRLADPARLVLELGLFASAAAASAVTVGAAVAAIFATVVLANEILLFVFRQRDR